MNTRAPSASRTATMIAFAASCVGLLLFLWLSFGGQVPFAAQGYRFTVEFDQAVQLGTQADVRIAGVDVGKVDSVGLDSRTGRTGAVIEVFPQFAPRPADTRAILRQKSLLGETYVELTPGNPHGPMLLDGGRLPRAQVAPTVQLDQILSTFDPGTRQAFETWMQEDGIAFTRRGQDFNAALAELYPFATRVESALTVLRRDSAATTVLLRDGGQALGAVAAGVGGVRSLQGLVRHAEETFAATAAQAGSLAAAVRAFPAFLAGTRATIARVASFAGIAKPLVDELRPAAVKLSPALVQLARLAPELRTVLVGVGPLTGASRAGEPALQRFLELSVPLLSRAKPYLGGLVPVIDYLGSYRRELAAFFANGTATSQGVLQNTAQTRLLHYLRVATPLNPETLTAYAHRPASNRANPYPAPGGYDLRGGLPVLGGYLCTDNALPTIGPSIQANLAAVLKGVYFTANPGGPPCKAQGPPGLIQTFPHLLPLP